MMAAAVAGWCEKREREVTRVHANSSAYFECVCVCVCVYVRGGAASAPHAHYLSVHSLPALSLSPSRP